jgi:transposase-like protein
MDGLFSFKQFITRFPDDRACLEEIRKLRYPRGISCASCKKVTRHYKLRGRVAYACQYCRKQVYPLAGTIFEKTTTPLRIWFYAFFLMTQTRADMSIKQLQRELGVTYKTAWRIYKQTRVLMGQNNEDLLKDFDKENKLFRWTFFNKIELKVVEKKESEN